MPYIDKFGNLKGYAFLEPGQKVRTIPIRTIPKKKTTVRKRRYYRSRPTRLQYSRRTYKKNTKIANALSMFSEKKYKGLTDVDEDAPNQITVGSIAYWNGYVLGQTVPTTWISGIGAWQPLDGFRFVQGIGNNSRDGRFMFLNNTTINCSVHMNSQPRNTPPVQFRMVVFKARRATTPTGVSYNPSETLFLDTNGNVQGHNAGMVGNDLMLQPLNRRDWIIIQDRKFTLQAPLATATTESASFQGKYPSFRRMRLNFNHKIKSAFGSTDQPEDYDYNFGIVIYASGVGRDVQADQWEFNLRGTTSAFDN